VLLLVRPPPEDPAHPAGASQDSDVLLPGRLSGVPSQAPDQADGSAGNRSTEQPPVEEPDVLMVVLEEPQTPHDEEQPDEVAPAPAAGAGLPAEQQGSAELDEVTLPSIRVPEQQAAEEPEQLLAIDEATELQPPQQQADPSAAEMLRQPSRQFSRQYSSGRCALSGGDS
jgi:hypothetical protein